MLGFPRPSDFAQTPFADAGHFKQTRGVFPDNIECLVAETIDDPVGIYFAHAVDGTAGEVTAYAFDGRGDNALDFVCPEFQSVLWMSCPFSSCLDFLAFPDVGRFADDRRVLTPVLCSARHSQVENGISSFFAVVDDVLHGA